MSVKVTIKRTETAVVAEIGSPWPLALLAKRRYPGRALPPVRSDRPACRIAQKKLAQVVSKFLRDMAPKISGQVVRALLKRGITKDAQTDLVDDIMSGVDLTAFNNLPKEVQPILQSLYADAGKTALRTVMVAVNASHGAAPDIAENAWDQVDAGAVEYSELRSAEMVGMRYDKATGKLVENPDAKWQITEETRAGIRSLVEQTVKGDISVKDLPRALQDSYAFSDSRASVIARTEMRLANGNGALGGLIAAGNVGQKVWITQEDDLVSEECADNADEGPIPLMDDFPSGDQTEPAHPNCRCSVTGHVEWDDEE